MTPETVMDLAHSTLMVTSMVAAPLLLIALAAGLVIGMLQAATQINEATLTFVPKLIVVALILMILGPSMVSQLTDFTRFVFETAAQAGR